MVEGGISYAVDYGNLARLIIAADMTATRRLQREWGANPDADAEP